jgi:carbon monoxide dehydrogenase subunit G
VELTGSRTLPAPPEAVWAALNDPEALRECIPGCESLTKESETTWRSVVMSRIGPVSARFNGTIELADVVPPSSYTIRFKGQGGVAGFANGEAQVRLAPAAAGQTALDYTARAQIGGKLAQIGSRLVDGAAASLAEEFFTRFAARFAPAPGAGEASQAEIFRRAPAASGLLGRPATWIVLAAIAALIAYLALT